MSKAAFSHIPVLLQQCLEGLAIDPKKNYLDGTVGGAGHSLPIAGKLRGGWLYCLDKDPTAVSVAAERLAGLPATVIEGDFRNAAALLPEGITLAGALLDLGVSSYQLDEAERGFSYHEDAPLDMRMDESASYTARELVNTVSYEELKRILYEYGEERYAPAIAKKICAYRTEKPIETTLELADLIRSAMPAAALREKQHPAKRSFQAIRIAVNDELSSVSRMMQTAVGRLASGGRLAVITFHSLEDRIVKNSMTEAAKGCVCPPSFPVCVCGRKPSVKVLTHKPIVSGEQELNENPRARSAKLRVCEKL